MTADDDDMLGEIFSSDRDRTGKDAPVEPAAPQPETKQDTPADPAAEQQVTSPGRDDKGRFVPLKSVLEERAKLQEARDTEARLRTEAEKRVSEYERKVRQYEEHLASLQRSQEPDEEPDPVTDPEGWARSLQTQLHQQALMQRSEMSEILARSQFGDEAVDAAVKAAREAGVAPEFTRSTRPFHDVVAWHKRHRALSEIGDDPTAYRTKLEAEIREKVLAELKSGGAPGTQPQPQRFPGSLAAASAAGAQGAHLSDEAIGQEIFGSGRRRK